MLWSPSFEEEHFLEGTCLSSSLKKISSSILPKEFRKNCRRFLEDLVLEHHPLYSCRAVSSWARTELFCPQIINGGDDYSAFHLFGQLLDGLLELGWVTGSEIEPAKAEFHSFVREERQVEVTGNRSRVPINSVFGFCNRPGFRSRRNLHKVSVVVLPNHFGVLMI